MRFTMTLAFTIVLGVSCGAANDDEGTEQGDLTLGDEDPTDGPVAVDPDDPDDPKPDEVVDVSPNSTTGPRLTDFHESFFVANGCTAGYCHAALALSSAESVYAAFVDVAAPVPLCGRTHYVVPGDPEQSILWLRIRDTTDEDVECEIVKMPAGGAQGMDPADTQVVYDWIASGANP